MRTILLVLLVTLTTLGYGQDFLGRWTVVKIFTTANFQKTDDNRMLLLIHQATASESTIEGVIAPVKTEIEFSINPNNQAQHVTLSTDGMLLMSMNWKTIVPAPPPMDPADQSLQVWLDGVPDYDVYSLLYNDEKTLVFSDRSRTGTRFLDIYYLRRKD